MTQAVVGKWGKNLAIRVPTDLARQTGLTNGEQVEVETKDGDLIIRRHAAHAKGRLEANAAAAEIVAASRLHRLDGLSIRDLRDEGRR